MAVGWPGSPTKVSTPASMVAGGPTRPVCSKRIAVASAASSAFTRRRFNPDFAASLHSAVTIPASLAVRVGRPNSVPSPVSTANVTEAEGTGLSRWSRARAATWTVE